jgi:hypothetical protein
VEDEHDRNWITLAQAAGLSGLGQRSLRSAADRGALRAKRVHPRKWLTTPQFLQDYLDNRPERFQRASEPIPAEGSGEPC